MSAACNQWTYFNIIDFTGHWPAHPHPVLHGAEEASPPTSIMRKAAHTNYGTQYMPGIRHAPLKPWSRAFPEPWVRAETKVGHHWERLELHQHASFAWPRLNSSSWKHRNMSNQRHTHQKRAARKRDHGEVQYMTGNWRGIHRQSLTD